MLLFILSSFFRYTGILYSGYSVSGTFQDMVRYGRYGTLETENAHTGTNFETLELRHNL